MPYHIHGVWPYSRLGVGDSFSSSYSAIQPKSVIRVYGRMANWGSTQTALLLFLPSKEIADSVLN